MDRMGTGIATQDYSARPSPADPLGQRDKPEIHWTLERLCGRLWEIREHLESVADRVSGYMPPQPISPGVDKDEYGQTFTSLVDRIADAECAVDAIANQLNRFDGRL